MATVTDPMAKKLLGHNYNVLIRHKGLWYCLGNHVEFNCQHMHICWDGHHWQVVKHEPH